MGLGKRQTRMIGPVGNGNIGSMPAPMPIGLNMALSLGQFNGDLYGNGQSQLGLMYHGALRIPGVYRAAMLLANLIAKSPWDGFTTHGQDQPKKLDPRPPLLDKPNPKERRVTVLRSAMLDRIFDGNAIFIIASRDSTGFPTATYPVPASWVGVRRVPMNVSTMIPIGDVEYSIGGQTFSSDDIIHVKGPCAPGALRGGGVLEMHLSGAFHTAHLQENEAQRMARHGVPAGILKFLNDSKAANDPKLMQKAVDAWMDARDTNAVAGMNSAVEFQALAWNPDQMQMVEARQLSLTDIANIMGVPPKFVNATTGDSLTYATSETGGVELLRDSLDIYFDEFEQAFSDALPRGTSAEFNRDKFTKPNQLQRAMANQIMIEAGYKLRSEARRDEPDLPPKPGIDDEPATAMVQKQLNKALPITDEGLKQITVGDLGGIPAAPKEGGQPVQAQATRLPQPALPAAHRSVFDIAMDQVRASQLEFGPGSKLWIYWTGPKGFARYAGSATPWETLRANLLEEGVPAHMADGLTTNVMMATPAGRALFAAHHGGKS